MTEVTDPQPGDIAVARPGWSSRGSGRTGDVGSHVTFVNDIDPRTGRFTGLGGNQSQRYSNYSIGRFQFFRPGGGGTAPAAQLTGAVPFLGGSSQFGQDLPRANIIDLSAAHARATSVLSDGGAARAEVSEGRQQMDLSAARQFFHHRVRGTGKIDVTVGETKGQQSTEQAGPFKKIPWHRHQQMTPAEHGPAETKEMTGGEGPGAGPG